jgi:hypothetical membrane protein
MKTKETRAVLALQMGFMIPFLYFGTQIIAAPFYPDYSFLSMPASLLGSDLARYPLIFNLGAIITGIVTLIASLGFLYAFNYLHVNPILAWLAFIALVLNGVSSLWAGIFSMPDPRHGSNPFALGIFLFPILLLAALWTQPDARQVKIYLIITNLLFFMLIPVMSGMTGLDIGAYQGLLQRIAALIFFPPISVGAWYLLKHIRPSPDGVRA